MRHVVKALIKLKESYSSQEEVMNSLPFIKIHNGEDKADELKIPPVVQFVIQSDPVSVVGVNGCQAVDMLRYVKCLFESLNEAFPCEENTRTLSSIADAIKAQQERTANRIQRNVEGKNEA